MQHVAWQLVNLVTLDERVSFDQDVDAVHRSDSPAGRNAEISKRPNSYVVPWRTYAAHVYCRIMHNIM